MMLRRILLALNLATMPLFADEILVTAPKEVEAFAPGTALSVIPVADADHLQVSVADVLQESAGVYVHQAYGLKDQSLSLRGFTGSQVKILLDGVPLQDATTSTLLSEIPLAWVDRIIVARGPSSSLYGSGAMGGVVNILSKKDLHSHEASLSYGSFATWKMRAQTLQKFSQDQLSLMTFWESTNGRYRTQIEPSPLYAPGTQPQNYTVENNAQKHYGARLQYSHAPFSSSLNYSERMRGLPGLDTHPTFSVQQRTRNADVMLAVETVKCGSFVHCDAKVFQRMHTVHYQDPLGEQNGFASDYSSRMQATGAEFAVKLLALDKMIPTLRLLVDRENFVDHSYNALRDSTLLSLSSDIYWGENDNFIVSPSLSLASASHLPQQRNYALNLWYAFNSEWSLSSQTGTSFRYPTFEELYTQQGFQVGNPNLSPEHSLGSDFGIQWQRERTQLRLTYFEYRTRDLIDSLLVSGFQYKPINFRSTRTRGVESEFVIGPFFATRLGGVLTRQDVIDMDRNSDDFGKFVPMKPRLYGRAFADYTWKAWVVLNYELSFARTRFINRSNTKKLPDNFCHNLGLALQTADSYRMRLDVRNLWDRQNIDMRGFPLAGRGYYVTVEKVF